MGRPKGWKHTEEAKRKIGDKNRGRKYTQEAKEKIREAAKNRIVSNETRKKMSKSHRGDKTNFWRGGVDKKEYKHYQNIAYRLWRERVFKRDDYTCQLCFIKSGNGKSVFLHPHHLKSYTHYPKLRYKTSNGKTLCQECHRKLHWKKYKEVCHRSH